MKQEQNKLRAGTEPAVSSKFGADNANGLTAISMNRKWVKRICALALALMAALSLAGCGKATPDEVIKASQQKLNAAESMSYDISTEMEMTLLEQTVNMTMKGTADYIAKPLAMHMELELAMDAAGQSTTKTSMYLQEKDGAYTAYYGADPGTGTEWTSKPIDNMEEMIQYSAQASMDMYMSNSASFAEKGTESINGSDAVRYDGTIPQEALSKVLKSSGALSQLAGIGLDESSVDSLMSDMGGMAISIWVDKASGLPVKYEMDMAQLVRKLLESVLGSLGSTEKADIGKMLMSMTIKSFNGVESIDIPEEALNS